MSTPLILTDATIPIWVSAWDVDGAPLTGATTLFIKIGRPSDDFLLDEDDFDFKASGWTTEEFALTEVSAANFPGKYKLSGGLALSAIGNWVTDDYLIITPVQTGASDAVLPGSVEVSVGKWADDVGGAAGTVDANVIEIDGVAAAAEALSDTYDGTGYVSGVAPATQDQIGQVTSTGAAVKVVAESYVLTTGTQSLGTFASTAAVDGANHEHTDDGGAMELYYQFLIGGSGIPVSVKITGRINTINKDMDGVYAWDWVGSAWTKVGDYLGQSGSTDTVVEFDLFTTHVGFSGADTGKVRIRFASAASMAGGTLKIDQIFVSYAVVNQSVGYENGAIWVDTNASNELTEDFVDGVADNPVSTWAAALTLNSSLGLNRFQIANGSTITLTGNSDNFTFLGDNWTLALGNQSIVAMHVNGASITGIGTGAGYDFHDCTVGDTIDLTIADGSFKNCALAGNIIATAAGTYFFDQCFSGVAGTDTPCFDFGAGVGSQNVNFRHYSGGIEIKNMGDTGTDKMSLEGHGQVVLNANCDGGTLAIRGAFTKTDNSGNITFSEEARLDQMQIADAQFNGAIYVDSVNGTAGTTGTKGTRGDPVDSIADALTISAAHGDIKELRVSGTHSLAGTLEGFTVIGEGQGSSINYNSQDVHDCHFTQLDLAGTNSHASPYNHYHDCIVGTSVNACGHYVECVLNGSLTTSIVSAVVVIDHCTSRTGLTLTALSTLADFVVSNWSAGALTVSACTDINTTFLLHTGGGWIQLSAGCTAGNATLMGFPLIVDLSGGSFVVNDWTGQEFTQEKILDDSTRFSGADIDAAISSRSDFDETSDPVELLDSGGGAGTSAAELVVDTEAALASGHGAGSWEGTSQQGVRDAMKLAPTGGAPANLSIDQMLRAALYPDGIYIDSDNGSPGTTNYVNGTSNNPVDSIADALSIGTSLGINRFRVASQSDLALVGALEGQEFVGTDWALDPDDNKVADNKFVGALIAGDMAALSTNNTFEDCRIDNSVIGSKVYQRCSLVGDLTLVEDVDYTFNKCFDVKQSGATPSVSLGPSPAYVNFHDYQGNIEIKSMAAGDVVQISGSGSITINANCSGGVMNISGDFTRTDNSGGSVTINEDTRYETQQVRDSQKLAPTVGAPAGGSVDEHLDDILADTDAMDTRLPTDPADESLQQAAHTQTQSDIAGLGPGGLTSQQTRDSMKLAPTGGAPAAGSIDEHLDDMPGDVDTELTGTHGAGAWTSGSGLTQQQARDAMKLAPSAGAPASDSIDDQLADMPTDVDTVLTGTHGAGSWTSGAAGTGIRQIDITVEDALAAPVNAASIDVYDAANVVFLFRVYTDAAGEVSVALDDATYQLRLFATGYSFTIPEEIVVTADAAETLAGTLIEISPPSSPDVCRIYGTVDNAGGTLIQGACVEAFATTPQTVAGFQKSEKVADTHTDGAGEFTLDLVRETDVRFVITDIEGNIVYEELRTVPDLATQALATWT